MVLPGYNVQKQIKQKVLVVFFPHVFDNVNINYVYQNILNIYNVLWRVTLF